ncbi:MAG: serine/threonine-protein kinase [Myxococcales bacterium]
MTAEPAARWRQVKALLAVALEKPLPLRGAYLEEACGEDATLRSEVDALLAAHREAGTFLDSIAGADRGAGQLSPGTRLGPYEVVELIGAGGMGQVYRARDARLGRDVAIKILPATGLRQQALQRFALEARAVGAINHPNILAVHDAGTYEGGPYLVFELLKGQTLREMLLRQPLPLGKALDLATQLAQGLSAAHDTGVVHRDLKPENLFVTTDGRLKILDFGIARLVVEGTPAEPSATLAGAVIGSVGYMSPEQVRGERADRRSDLFVFGLILHEMLTGKIAFKRESSVETGCAIVYEEPPRLPEGTPRELVRLVRRCLEKEPQDRFQSVHELAARLATVPSTPPGGRRQGSRRLHIALLLIGIGLLAAALALVYVFVLRRPPARAEADRSVAVLPFASLSTDKENEFFAEGVHSEIITQLGRMAGLKVIARSSVQQYRDGARDPKSIGEALGVSTLVEGTVQRVGTRVRIAAQLIDAASSRQLWSDRFDRELADSFAIQTDVALEIARQLGAKLTPDEKHFVERAPTRDPEAHELYLRAIYYAERSSAKVDSEKARDLAEQAIARDPAFALAHAFVSVLYSFQQLGCARARQHADRALALQPDLPEAHGALLFIHGYCEVDWPAATQEGLIAVRGLPGDAMIRSTLGLAQMRAGDEQAGLANLRRAFVLDPHKFDVAARLALYLLTWGQFDEAERVIIHLRLLNPDDETTLFVTAALASWRDGDFEPLRKVLGRLPVDVQLGPGWWWLLLDVPEGALALVASNRGTALEGRALIEGCAQFTLGHAGEAKAAFEVMLRQVQSRQAEWLASGHLRWGQNLLAAAYSGLGRADEALAALRSGGAQLPARRHEQLVLEARDALFVGRQEVAFARLDEALSQRRALTPAYLRASRFFAPLRADPRFAALLAKYETARAH